MSSNPLHSIGRWSDDPQRRYAGLPSICSAHPVVIETVIRALRDHELPILIEATCNQVNQDGGYTGMTPTDFRDFVYDIAARVGVPAGRIVLGGDHLGPNPWKHLSAPEALDKARAMVEAYAAAGFAKLHLDCSMGCAGEPEALKDAEVAERASALAQWAEAALPDTASVRPVYVIGTEVPVPGGALAAHHKIEVTSPDAAEATLSTHQAAFARRGLEEAFGRVIAIVVQPGVEFGDDSVSAYDPIAAKKLRTLTDRHENIVFEAHSTDYQSGAALAGLVRDKFSILKVGPALTFGLREGLYGLDLIAEELAPTARKETLRAAMERIMLAAPDNWRKYYDGSQQEQVIKRHFSYSDRIRYYWQTPDARQAVAELHEVLGGRNIPFPLLSQYVGQIARHFDGHARIDADAVLRASVEEVLDVYIRASMKG